MDPHRRLLLYEIELQSGFALKAYADADRALGRRDPKAFWHAVQTLLVSAMHIRAYFAADADLRRGLGVAEDSALLRPELQTALDPHAMLQWIDAHPRGPLRLTNLGPFGANRADPSVFARYVDADTSVVTIFGRRHDLAALLADIARLGESIDAELSRLKQVM